MPIVPSVRPRPDGGQPINEKFDPLSLHILSQNLRQALDQSERESFPPEERFVGAGLYALYYNGSLPLYAGRQDRDVPVYVGKAEAGNSSYGDPFNEDKPKLYDRIAKHARSVEEVAVCGGDLATADFDVRYLLLDDLWIVLGERALLRAYAPVLWNTIMPGFGANPPGAARQNARSVWDTIHSGRPRAGALCNRRFTRSEMEHRVRRGIEISLMNDGSARDAALGELRKPQAQMIWSPPRKGARDKRLRVFRVDVFELENAAIGTYVPPEDWSDASGHESEAIPDPEEEAEQNVLAAEDGEADGW
jgi:Eco29kI restriction endonuclease